MALIAQARATGARVITVLYSGRPMVLGAALDASDAFVAAWLPGTEGCGLTDVLFGAPNPKAYSRALGRARTNSSQIVSDPATADVEFTRGFELSY